MSDENIVKRSVSITQKQDAWLKTHREVNFSAWVQKQLQKMIEEAKA